LDSGGDTAIHGVGVLQQGQWHRSTHNGVDSACGIESAFNSCVGLLIDFYTRLIAPSIRCLTP
jgi:hypothetical protein